jgi:1-deoxy-D-xylulose-5-phosphate synthase
LQLGLPDEFVEHGDYKLLMSACGLDSAGIAKSIKQRFPIAIAPIPVSVGK